MISFVAKLFSRRRASHGLLDSPPIESSARRREDLERERVLRAEILLKLNRRFLEQKTEATE